MVALDSSPVFTPTRAFIGAAVLFVLELALIGTLFKHWVDFNCLENWPAGACSGASGTMVAIYCITGTLILMGMLKPEPFRTLVQQAGFTYKPLLLNLVGVAVALIPIALLENGQGSDALVPSFLFWSIGMTLMLAGLAIFLAPISLWRQFLSSQWTMLLPVMAAGAVAPFLATMIRPIWKLDTVTDATFVAVTKTVGFMGYQVDSWPIEKIIGADGFYIDIAPQCSGVEGLALVTIFVSIYLGLFRSELKFPRALLLYPIGLAASAVFNILRISVLIAIGLEGNPELAVGGFHSHAGWLMFTLVALGIIALAVNLPWLQKDGIATARHVTPPLPFFQDPAVARILPFAVFMLSALLATVMTQSPALFYPARVILMAGILALFLPVLRALPFRIDPVALAVGAVIGLGWVLIPVPATSGPAPYGNLVGIGLVAWMLFRGIGTIVLVPIIEELFFRDYLESRLRLGNGRAWRIFAALITAILFAALHDRWAEAFVAGLAFSWVMQRKGMVVDAIAAHAVANAVVFGIAVATSNLSII